jgi:hypothetical protein
VLIRRPRRNDIDAVVGLARDDCDGVLAEHHSVEGLVGFVADALQADEAVEITRTSLPLSASTAARPGKKGAEGVGHAARRRPSKPMGR